MKLVLQPSQYVSHGGAVVRSIGKIRRGRATEKVSAAIHEETEIRDAPKVVGVRGVKGVRDVVDFVVEVAPSVRSEEGISAKDFIFRLIVVLR